MESSIDITRHINAPVERVWRIITDIDNAADVLDGIVRIERLGGDGYEVGTRWRETRRMMGREASEEMWVTEVEPPRRTVIGAEHGTVRYETEFELADSDGGTAVTMRFSATMPERRGLRKLADKAMVRLGTSITRKAMEKDLDSIARAAERAT
ncbi:SRPBCC family protein [Lolliginicoccus suaedae]|uniref:SRPBCC family protein n=1 Tax=Lolliginicoccus suaedae TaxID=2605429 RepID=UPI0011ED0931|nr:SRPBCC family protein [Lolliginicoccus suaedae]